jgi:hypothetical protein
MPDSIIFEQFRTIENLDAGLFANELIVRAFIRVLKSAPAADVIDNDEPEIRVAALRIIEQLLEGFPTSQQ